MKRFIQFALVLWSAICWNLHAQTDYSAVDEFARSIPDTLSNYKEIATVLSGNFTREDEKIRALYIWITHNIKYDVERSTRLKAKKDSTSLNEIIETRKGICQDYSMLFHEMCRSIGIKSYYISGVTKGTNQGLSSLSHAWNAVQIGTAYYLLDMTWAAGYVNNGFYHHVFRDKYFLESPQQMISSHLPFDPLWQFLLKPVSLAEFIDGRNEASSEDMNWNYQDSIVVYENRSEIQRLNNSTRRILAYNTPRNGAELPKMIRRKIDFNYYRLVVAYINVGVDHYNSFVQQKSSRFKNPKLNDLQIRELLTEAKDSIQKADQVLSEYSPEDSIVDELFWILRDKVARRWEDLTAEEDYLVRYLKTWRPLRIFVM